MAESTGSLAEPPKSTPFATRLLPDSRETAASLLSVREVARRLGVHPHSVYKLCDRGDLPHIRVLNTIRVSSEDLARFSLSLGRMR